VAASAHCLAPFLRAKLPGVALWWCLSQLFDFGTAVVYPGERVMKFVVSGQPTALAMIGLQPNLCFGAY
jgi:hypothetical protein